MRQIHRFVTFLSKCSYQNVLPDYTKQIRGWLANVLIQIKSAIHIWHHWTSYFDKFVTFVWILLFFYHNINLDANIRKINSSYQRKICESQLHHIFCKNDQQFWSYWRKSSLVIFWQNSVEDKCREPTRSYTHGISFMCKSHEGIKCVFNLSFM